MGKPSKNKGKQLAGHRDRRRKFVLAYCANGFRGTQAAIEAGYSPLSAHVQSSHLLADAKVRKEINDIADEHFATLRMGAAETLGRLAAIARSDIRLVRDATGKWIEPTDLQTAACVAAVDFDEIIETDEDGKETRRTITRKVKLRDPVPALDRLARYHRLIDAEVAPPKVEQTVAGVDLELARRIAFALARANAQTLPVIES